MSNGVVFLTISPVSNGFGINKSPLALIYYIWNFLIIASFISFVHNMIQTIKLNTEILVAIILRIGFLTIFSPINITGSILNNTIIN